MVIAGLPNLQFALDWVNGGERTSDRASGCFFDNFNDSIQASKLVLKMEMISSNDELIIIEIDMRRICKHDMRTTKIWRESNNSSSGGSINDNNLHACYSFNSLHLHTLYLHLITINVQCVHEHQTWFPLKFTQIHSKVFVIDVHCCFFSLWVVEIGFADARYACCAWLVGASHSFPNSTADIVEKVLKCVGLYVRASDACALFCCLPTRQKKSRFNAINVTNIKSNGSRILQVFAIQPNGNGMRVYVCIWLAIRYCSDNDII